MFFFLLQIRSLALPVLAEFDWNQVFYFLIPLVYVAAQFFGGDKKKKKTLEDEGPEVPQPQAEGSDRLRRVQEEIRRRIAEQRAGADEAQEVPDAPVPSLRRESSYDPARRSRAHQPAPEAAPPPVPVAPRTEYRQPVPRPAESGDSLVGRLRQQREQLAKSRVDRDAAFSKAREISGVRSSRAGTRGREAPVGIEAGPMRDHVLASLATPESARVAFVLTEVFGLPKSLRSVEEDPMGHEWPRE